MKIPSEKKCNNKKDIKNSGTNYMLTRWKNIDVN